MSESKERNQITDSVNRFYSFGLGRDETDMMKVNRFKFGGILRGFVEARDQRGVFEEGVNRRTKKRSGKGKSGENRKRSLHREKAYSFNYNEKDQLFCFDKNVRNFSKLSDVCTRSCIKPSSTDSRIVGLIG